MVTVPFKLLLVLLPRFWAHAVSTPASHNGNTSRQLESNPGDNHAAPTDEELGELYRQNYGEEPPDLTGLHRELDQLGDTSSLDVDELNALLNRLEEGAGINSTMSRLFGSGTSPGGGQGCGDGGAEHQLGCVATWDDVLCWPESPPGQLVTIRCFKEFNGVKYHGRNNASRYCHLNGSWEEKANYSACAKTHSEMGFDVDDTFMRSEHASIIYLCGYSLSLVVLCCATWIFAVCKDLHCLRNTIHANLFITYILTDSLWITSLCIELFMSKSTVWSCVIVVFLHYCHVSTFFWMFVEGHYLYMLVVQTFSADKIRCRLYMSIGWGIPLVVMITWALVKGLDNHTRGEMTFAQCPWLTPSDWDWLFMGPTITVLIFNIIFLIRIMWVLITKLRSTNSAETKQYQKATKALLVLVPLLGLTYILVFAPPSGGLVAHVFTYLQPILISTQATCHTWKEDTMEIMGTMMDMTTTMRVIMKVIIPRPSPTMAKSTIRKATMKRDTMTRNTMTRATMTRATTTRAIMTKATTTRDTMIRATMMAMLTITKISENMVSKVKDSNRSEADPG